MSIPPPGPPPPESGSSLASIMRTTLSYDTNIMLAAIISLLLVILFVLFLHLYTRWFLLQARRRSRTSVAVPSVLGSRLHQRFTIIDTTDHSSGKLGLPFSIISSLPLFIYKFPSIEEDGDDDYGLECSICLSIFEEDEIGRKLPGCGHAFHVECIDMWLRSHSTCPICRAAIRCNHSSKIDQLEIEVTDVQLNSSGLAINNEEELQFEIATTISNQIDVRDDNDSAIGVSLSSSSSSTEESQSQLSKKCLIAGSSCSCSCSSRSGGKVHPSSSSVVNGGEPEV